MVTLIKYGALSGGEKYNVNVLSIDGLSTDTKPTVTYIEYGSDGREVGRMGIPNGSIFTEIDTGDTYMYDVDATTWHKVSIGGGGGGTQGGIVLVGETTTALTDEATTNPITVDGQSYTAQPNDAVIYGSKEFLFDGTKWHEFGDLSGLASKDIGAMTGYAKASTGSAITTTDTLNQAIGKVEKRVETNENNILNGNIGIDTPHSNNTATTGNVELIIGQAVDSTTGIITSSNNYKRATHKELFTASVAECADNDFVIAIYCYDIVTGEYIGRIIEDGSVSKSGTIKYANSFSLSSLYKYRLQLKRVDNGDFTINDINNSISITINSDTVSAIIRNNMYAVIGSPAVYIPTAITGENINNLTVSDIYNDYDALVTANSNVFMRDANIGMDSDNNPIRAYTYMYTPLLRTTENSISADACDSIWSQDIDTKHILICSGVHGDEKTSVLGVLNLITELLTSTDDWAMFLKSNFVIHIVPILNPWGFNNMSRVNKDGVNINRDYDTFATSEARAMRDYIARYGHNIKAVIDSHNTNTDGVYIGTNPNFRKHKMYCRLAVNTAATLKSYLASVYSSSKFPYMWAWQTANTGTLNEYCNNTVGVSSITLETPRNYAGGSDNNSEVTPLVKAVIANVVQYMGLIS